MPSKKNKAPIEEVISGLADKGVRFIYLQFTDVIGALKSVIIPLDQFPDAIERGQWFDGSSVEGFARVLESDMYLKPDLATLSTLPWEEDGQPAARVLCSVLKPNGEPFAGDPRNALLRVTEEAAALGFEYLVAPELEFYLYSPGNGNQISPLSQDQAGYFGLSSGLPTSLRKEMVTALQGMSVKVHTAHHELGAGQEEIDFARETAVTGADNLITARYILKAIAQKHGLSVTFMPKPIEKMEGSGLHVHQSLRHKLQARNAFCNASDDYGLSETARYFLAGLLYHARAMSPILNPLINSYKRLVRGFEAPVYITWARVNRSALVRVPQVNSQKLDTTRLEIRNPDPSCNSYLAFAVMLKCGLHGIQEKLPLPPPTEENLFAMDSIELQRRQISSLPDTLGQALEEFKKDMVVREALGDLLFNKLLETKTREWQEYCQYVTPWELERYLGI